MKTYNVTKRLSSQARQQAERIINTHNKYKNAYFWNSSGSADNRRRNEIKFSESNPPVRFIDGDDIIEVEFSYSESCKNVYYSMDITVNGSKKDIRTIKKLLSRV